jgi:hypothetical protein
MAIKKDPSTGKYYIAPSPPSFYKSKPSPPSSGGGGGGTRLTREEISRAEGTHKDSPTTTRSPAAQRAELARVTAELGGRRVGYGGGRGRITPIAPIQYGFSSADPSLAKGAQVAASRDRRIQPTKTVFRDSKGYSVAPSLQQDFMRPTPPPTPTRHFFGLFGKPSEELKAKRAEAGWKAAPIPALISGVYNWGGSKTIQTGESLVGQQRKKLDYWGIDTSKGWLKTAFEKEGPLSRRQASEVIGSAYMFASFGPLLKTGTAQQMQSQYVWDAKLQRFVKKSDLRTYLSATREGKTIRLLGKGAGDYTTKAAKVRILLRAAKDNPSRAKLLKIVEESYGKQFVRDFVSQEGIGYAPSALVVAPRAAPVRDVFAIKGVEMPRIDVVLTSVKTSQNLFQPSQISRTALSSMTFLQPQIVSGQKVKQPQIPKQETKITQKSRPAQTSLQVQAPRLATPSPQVPRLRPIPRAFGIPKVKPGKKTGMFLSFPDRRILPIGAATGESWIPQVMYKGKWKTVGKRMDRNSALSRASKGADFSTSRRFRIKPSKKAPQVTSILGWSTRGHKFRPYRKVKGQRVDLVNTFIEKKTFGIDTLSERRGLSIAKLSKNQGWLAGSKSNKKFKRKSPWLF